MNISKTAFKIAGGITLFLVALNMAKAKCQTRKRVESKSEAAADNPESDNISI